MNFGEASRIRGGGSNRRHTRGIVEQRDVRRRSEELAAEYDEHGVYGSDHISWMSRLAWRLTGRQLADWQQPSEAAPRTSRARVSRKPRPGTVAGTRFLPPCLALWLSVAGAAAVVGGAVKTRRRAFTWRVCRVRG
jgi:hypothetical protein